MLTIELPYDPVILLLVFTQRIQNHQFEKIYLLHPYVYCSIVDRKHILEAGQVSIDIGEWIKKLRYIYT